MTMIMQSSRTHCKNGHDLSVVGVRKKWGRKNGYCAECNRISAKNYDRVKRGSKLGRIPLTRPTMMTFEQWSLSRPWRSAAFLSPVVL